MIYQASDQVGFNMRQLLDGLGAATNGTAPAGATGTSGASGASPPVYLTPDAVMAYCQSRLQGIDTQVQVAMNQQQNCNTEQNAIQSLLSDVSNLQNEVGSDGVTKADPAACKAFEQDIEAKITQIERIDPGCSQLPALKQLHDSVMASGTGPYGSNPQHGYYNGSTSGAGAPPNGSSPPDGSNSPDGIFGGPELTSFTTTLQGINNNLNNSAELGMIQIQSLMSQRSTAIQLSTNILQSLNDGTSKITDNIGH